MNEATLRHFIFQTFGRARRTQDSPIVPDVWLRYIRLAEDIARARIAGNKPAPCVLDLLLTPWSGTRPGEIANALRWRLGPARQKAARIAQSSTRVVAHVDFLTLVNVVVPITGWWQKLKDKFRAWDLAFDPLYEKVKVTDTLAHALSKLGYDIEFFRYAALVGFIDRLLQVKSVEDLRKLEWLAFCLGAAQSGDESADETAADVDDPTVGTQHVPTVNDIADLVAGYQHAVGSDEARNLRNPEPDKDRAPPKGTEQIYLINLNRPATQGLFESRSTVKGDASQRLFEIRTTGLHIAVVDGGIDSTHQAFLNRLHERYKEEEWPKDRQIEKSELADWSRVVATYDFTILRDIMACGSDADCAPEANRPTIARLAANDKYKTAFEHLKTRDQNARDLDWDIVQPLIKLTPEDFEPPGSDHGTHVAGIIAANLPKPQDSDQPIIGMCPDVSLYDMRVFDREGEGDEFAILCALEFVGWLNRDRSNPVIHGVNLSLALRHDVDSFACGQTPICEACNFLVGSGTVVVAAAGNTGFETAAHKQSLGNGYRSISITDPGNAEAVITVGSTHRRDPHAYGVSFFSGRGPTGDGRRKPDILAPGEKITSTIRGGRSQRMDGTSMAAPHVTGAAALLMARYPELVGRPLRIKEILMSTATDLKREPYFQGAGLLDVLRALQAV